MLLPSFGQHLPFSLRSCVRLSPQSTKEVDQVAMAHDNNCMHVIVLTHRYKPQDIALQRTQRPPRPHVLAVTYRRDDGTEVFIISS